jgi:heme/copper-type cytochrome/quinol oxidase subunit 4
MLTKRYITIFSRIFAGLLIALGTSLWLISWWYAEVRLGEELNAPLIIVLLTLHLIGALGGFRATVIGILIMIILTVLSLIAPVYLNIPFRPASWINFLYIMLICAQIVLLFFCFIKKERSDSMNRSA